MQFTQDLPEGHLFFRNCTADAVTVVDRVLTGSFLLAPDRLVEDWPVTAAAQFDAAAAEAIAALSPEVVLLGTGARQVFPPREPMVALLRRRIGVEVMDNAAACRTYNLLAGEGRRVVAAIMLPKAAGDEGGPAAA
ncbi:Mth938-like domain-containing protein [Dokdonella ginsengisoli]|uniref:Mth938-like domain-containing protein n=1 Tax=Dokdonella ginsengisoli TaxID=363846 RepID=A0ABV9QWK3_9GAMM